MNIETFIHTNRIYSKCSPEDKKLIDAEIEKAKINERMVRCLEDDLEKACEKNGQLLERIKRLEERLL